MRILVLAAPDGEAARAAVSEALGRWNRGLDIRLRFLNLGLEEVVLALPDPAGDPGAGLEAVEEAVRSAAPAVALLHGRGSAALAAAVSLSKAGIPSVRTAAGLRDGPGGDADRAADRLCQVLLGPTEAALAALAAEGLEASPFTADAAVKAVIRLQREP